jgi:hypothetical protein
VIRNEAKPTPGRRSPGRRRRRARTARGPGRVDDRRQRPVGEGLGEHPARVVGRRPPREQGHDRRRDVDLLGLLRVEQRVVEARRLRALERLLLDLAPAADDRERVVARLGRAVVAVERVDPAGTPSPKAVSGLLVTNRSPVRSPAMFQPGVHRVERELVAAVGRVRKTVERLVDRRVRERLGPQALEQRVAVRAGSGP